MQVGDTVTVKTWRHARHKCTCGNVHDAVVIDGVYQVTVTEEVYRSASLGKQRLSFKGVDEDDNKWHIRFDYLGGRGYSFSAKINGKAVWAKKHLPHYWNYIEADEEYRHE